MPSCDSPTLVCEHQPQLPVIDGHGVGVTVVNFNTSAYTAHCIASLAMAHTPPARILVLDNGSSAEAFDALIRSVEALPRTHLLIYRSEQNLGFACGSNFLVDRLREWDGCCYVGLLNNDAQAEPIWTDALVAALQANPGLHGMAGGRMHKLRNTSEVDTLGISIYGSLMPADRLRTDDLYMGPTGGCCLMTRACVEDIIAETGYFFDPRFFCYCEDTDLVLRANLLGYQPAYVDELVAVHAGQASSSVRKAGFIAYHGWRNVMWLHVKLIPTTIFLRHAHWLLLAHAMSLGRYVVTGQFGFVWRVYRDAFRLVPVVLKERVALKPRWRIRPAELDHRICQSFYRQGYILKTLRQLIGRGEPA